MVTLFPTIHSLPYTGKKKKSAQKEQVLCLLVTYRQRYFVSKPSFSFGTTCTDAFQITRTIPLFLKCPFWHTQRIFFFPYRTFYATKDFEQIKAGDEKLFKPHSGIVLLKSLGMDKS